MAGIIKVGGDLSGGCDVQHLAFNFDDLSGKANDYLGTVQRHAAQIVQRAQQEAEAIRKRAAAEGLQNAKTAAEQTARAELERKLQTLLPALQETVRTIQQAKHAWLQYWENNAIQLAAAIAARVIRREISHAPDITLEWIRESLQLAAGSGQLTLRLHPQDHAALGDQAAELAGRLNSLAALEIVADPHIEPGGCRVDTQFGSIDQQIHSQLARIQEELA